MANPQAENGHTDIANEIMDHLADTRMSGSEWQIIIYVLRKTYGWHKKEDCISLSQFCQNTNLSRKGVCIAIKKVVNKCILVVNKDTLSNRYKFNKNWEEWVVNKKTLPVNKTRRGSEQNGRQVVNKTAHTNSNTKETIQKKYISKYPKMILDEEKEILQFFKDTYQIKSELPNTNEQIKASKWLFKEKGLDKSKKAILAAWNCRGKEFAPSINSLVDLRDKYGNLEEYYMRLKERSQNGTINLDEV